MLVRAGSVAVLAMTASLLAVPDVQAFGRRKAGCSSNCTPVSTSYSSFSACEETTAGCGTAYVTKEVTCYRMETRTRQVPVTVLKMVPRTEEYTYTVMVPHTVMQKQTVTEYQQEMKPETYQCTVMQMVCTPEQRTVTRYQMVQKPEEYTYTVMQPETVIEKRNVTRYQTVQKPEEYTYTVM